MIVVLLGSVALGGTPSLGDSFIGAASGIFVALALLSFYRSMARGKMAVVAPVSAVASVGVPLVVGVAGGDRLSALGWLAILAGLVGIALASAESEDREEENDRSGGSAPVGKGAAAPSSRRLAAGAGAAMLAGLGFGAYLSLIGRTGTDSGLWPLFASRVTSLLTLAILAAWRGQLRSAAPAVREAAAAGLFDGLGNSFYALASQRGELAVVGTIGSMYPASTVGLAALVHHERPRAYQVVGIVLLLACVAILGAG
jgi:drug/metabolite transporter (DMT)-like permease